MASHLVPVRVDAKCNTGYRIIDTLLVDPTCLPRPLSEFRTANEAVEANVRILSDNLISDYEVAAIESAGYRQNYFTGRVALLNVPDLRGEVERQIRRALWEMVDGDATAAARGGHKKRKSKSGGSADDSTESEAEAVTKKQKVDEDDGEDQPTGDDGDADDGSNAEKDKAADADGGDGDDADATGDDGSDDIDKSDLVKINIRIRDDKRKILVLDEFYVDPKCSLPGGDVVSVAKSLVKDLNLPADMELTIITTILEQIHGLKVPADLHKAKVNVRKDTGEIVKTEVNRETPAALYLS